MEILNKTCSNCHRTFTTNANYTKHINRKKPCDTVELTDEILARPANFKCDRCESAFATNQKLTSHINRKFPCKIKEVKEADAVKEANEAEQSGFHELFEQLQNTNEQQQLQINQLTNQLNEIKKDKTTNQPKILKMTIPCFF
jgi:uncharacterized C2H2 Zn-finger protein